MLVHYSAGPVLISALWTAIRRRQALTEKCTCTVICPSSASVGWGKWRSQEVGGVSGARSSYWPKTLRSVTNFEFAQAKKQFLPSSVVKLHKIHDEHVVDGKCKSTHFRLFITLNVCWVKTSTYKPCRLTRQRLTVQQTEMSDDTWARCFKNFWEFFPPPFFQLVCFTELWTRRHGRLLKLRVLLRLFHEVSWSSLHYTILSS